MADQDRHRACHHHRSAGASLGGFEFVVSAVVAIVVAAAATTGHAAVDPNSEPRARADAEDNFRKAVGQVSRGLEQLASDRPTMQLGGIYAVDGVMNSAPEYRQQVLEALCAFVRDNTRG